jgi:hypothetical protein
MSLASGIEVLRLSPSLRAQVENVDIDEDFEVPVGRPVLVAMASREHGLHLFLTHEQAYALGAQLIAITDDG